MTQPVGDYIAELHRMIDLVPAQLPPIEDAIFEAYLRDRTIFLVGNGGSAANATHFAQDLSKGAIDDPFAQKRFRAHALTDNNSLLTAVSNDIGYDAIFTQQLATFARPGDLLIAISGSGNSPNVVRAIEFARAHGLVSVGLTGFDGGALGRLADLQVHVPSHNMGLVEAVHAVIFHIVAARLRARVLAETAASL